MFGGKIMLVTDGAAILNRIAIGYRRKTVAVTGRFATLMVIKILEIGAKTSGRPACREHRMRAKEAGKDDLVLPVNFYTVIESVDKHDCSSKRFWSQFRAWFDRVQGEQLHLSLSVYRAKISVPNPFRE